MVKNLAIIMPVCLVLGCAWGYFVDCTIAFGWQSLISEISGSVVIGAVAGFIIVYLRR